MMPEADRIPIDEDDIPWDADNPLPEWIEGSDNAAISGTRNVD